MKQGSVIVVTSHIMEVLELPVVYRGKNRDFAVWLSWMVNLGRRLDKGENNPLLPAVHYPLL